MELGEVGQIWSTPRQSRNSPFWNSRIKVPKHTSVNLQKISLPCLPSIWNLHSHDCLTVGALFQALGGAGHPPGYFVSGSHQKHWFSFLEGFTPAGPMGNYISAFPVAFFTPLLSRTGVQMYNWCSSRESEAFSFFLHTLKLHYWFPVTCLQAWLILCKTEDFIAILQRDLKSPDFP